MSLCDPISSPIVLTFQPRERVNFAHTVQPRHKVHTPQGSKPLLGSLLIRTPDM